ncbi:MAG: hypothetical protein LBK99_24620, partial [Opitutaceae bacterium]|nr:hypothetical protein [Opitutaceae bacterium]
MARLNRIHITGLGLDAARFNPVTLDFRDAGATPAHTIIWLRNGGGKTTLLSFLYSTLLPHANDWLGRHNGRITDIYEYLRERQTGYILLEFQFPSLGIHRVIAQSIRKNPASTRARERTFFTFRTDGPLAWDDIPLTGLASPPSPSPEQLFQHLQTLSEKHPPDTIAFYKTTNQGDWRQHLESIGLDPEIYRTHLLMNADEGGLLKFFDFKTPESFVEKLLDMTYETPPPPDAPQNDTPTTDNISQTIDAFRQRSHARPDLTASATFCKNTITVLTSLKTELDIVTHHQRQRIHYRQRATHLLRTVGRHIASLQTGITALETEIKLGEDIHKDATRQKQQNRVWKKNYEHHRRILALAEAEQHLHDATGQLARTRAWHAALITARRHKQIKNCETLITNYRAQKQNIEKEHAPKRQQLERLGHTLRILLGNAITLCDQQIATHDQEKSTLTQETRHLQKQQNQHIADEATARTKLDTAQKFLEEADAARETLRAENILSTAETAAAAIDRLEKIAAGHENRSRQYAEHITRNETLIEQHRDGIDTKEKEHRDTLTRRADLHSRLAQIDDHAIRLRQNPEIIRELGDPQHDPTASDPEKNLQTLQNPSLATALKTRSQDCHHDLLAKNLEGASDRRIIGHCEKHPDDLFPPPSGIENTLKKLRDAGITSAISAYHWLGQNCEISDALHRLAAHPSLYSGIIIQNPEHLKLARAHLAASETTDLPILRAMPQAVAGGGGGRGAGGGGGGGL